MKMPIDVVPNTNPPRFRWSQTVTTPNGPVTVHQEGMIPPQMEGAVVKLIDMYKALVDSYAVMSERISSLPDQAASKQAEQKSEAGPARTTNAPNSRRKG